MKRTPTPSSISPHPFTPIEEGNEDDERHRERTSFRATPRLKKTEEKVFLNKCRPINPSSHIASPNAVFRSVLSSLAPRKTPRSPDWKLAAAELSDELALAVKKRDEAILESSNLKSSVADLENKLNSLEIFCRQHHHKTPPPRVDYRLTKVGNPERVIEHFLVSVSEARSAARGLAHSLSRQIGAKVYDRISSLLQPNDPLSSTSRGLLLYLEALLNKALFDDFESIGFQRGSTSHILNPIERCESNFAMFTSLRGLTWEDVLSKGTRHFSEDFSKFCDRKMSEIVAMLGWNRAWPEPLLQAFFGASKAVWLVHVLANSVHPGLPVFRVDQGVKFDSVYMEDMGGEKAKRFVPSVVRIMVSPGFYVYDNVVKCKVLCRYSGNRNGWTPSPSPS